MDVKIGKHGVIKLLDVMGNDQSIVDAARISYKNSKKRSDDESLLRYLMRHRHTTPFEQAELKFYVKVPMDTWRQWVRHRTASINEYSTRYSLAINETEKTDTDSWRLQSVDNKQGSSKITLPDEVGAVLSFQENALHSFASEVYEAAIRMGVAKEQARRNLLLCTYTEAFWKINLHNLLHFLELRLDPNSQEEIRQYAEAIAIIVEEKFPLTWKAFKDYRLNAITFSRQELAILKELLNGGIQIRQILIPGYNNTALSRRECSEFKNKLIKTLESN